MDAELSAAASSKAASGTGKASDTRTGAGKASGTLPGTGTGSASDAHATASPQPPGDTGSVLHTGNAAGVSLGGVATTAEAEALAEVRLAAHPVGWCHTRTV